MPPNKPKESRKKRPIPPPALDPRQKEPAGDARADGFTGEGFESILARLRDLEKKSPGEPDKSGR